MGGRRYRADESEEENEHGGDILNEPHDEDAEGDKEPELGATTTLNQEHAWAPQSDRRWYVTDGEPSLGWSNGHGHPEAAMRGYDDDRESDMAEWGIADRDGELEQGCYAGGVHVE